MASEINIYSLFQISEIIIPDWKKTILDIPKQVRIWNIQKQLGLFWISKTISDIRK